MRGIRRGGALLRRKPAARPQYPRPRRERRAFRGGFFESRDQERADGFPAHLRGRQARRDRRRRRHGQRLAWARRSATGQSPLRRSRCCPSRRTSRAESNPWPEWPRVCKVDYGQEEAIAVFGHDPRIYETTIKEILKDESGNIRAVRTVKLKGARRDSRQRSGTALRPAPARSRVPGLPEVRAGRVRRGALPARHHGGKPRLRNCRTRPVQPRATCAGGQSLVVWAITEGKEAARAVDKYLMGYTV